MAMITCGKLLLNTQSLFKFSYKYNLQPIKVTAQIWISIKNMLNLLNLRAYITE